MFTIVLFIIAPEWKHPKCASIGKCIDKLWCIQTRNELLIHSTTLVNLKNMLNKSLQTQEDILSDSIYRNSRKGKTNLRWKTKQ